MLIRCIWIGKTEQPWLEPGIDEYLRRINRYGNCQIEILPLPKNAGQLQPEERKKIEGQKLLEKLTPHTRLVLWDENGLSCNSVDFSRQLNKWNNSGIKELALVIGGAYGFSEEIYARASQKIALSPMTFSHQLVRLICMEQLYRAFSILHGDPYHHV